MGIVKKVFIGIGIAFGVMIAIFIAVGVLSVGVSVVQDERQVLEPTLGERQEAEEVEEENIEFSVGDPITVAGISYNITTVKTVTKQQVAGGIITETALGTYVKVYLQIENLTNESLDVQASEFLLIDGKERQFDNVVIGFGWTGSTIQPNLPINKVVNFDVAFDDNLEYKLKVKPSWDSCPLSPYPRCNGWQDENAVLINLGVGKDL